MRRSILGLTAMFLPAALCLAAGGGEDGAVPTELDKRIRAVLAQHPGAVDMRGGLGVGRLTVSAEPGAIEVHTRASKQLGPILSVRTRKPAERRWQYQLSGEIAHGAERGDAILLTFRARSNPSSPEEVERARTEIVVEENRPDWTKVLSFSLRVGRRWKQFAVPLRSGATFPADRLALMIRAGYPPQTIELADLRIHNFASAVAVSDLPSAGGGYEGRAPDAPWRAEALARIERIRKADLDLRVLDAAGKPVAGASVELELIRHAFGFGSAVAASMVAPENVTDDVRRYRAKVVELYNVVTIENNLKWNQWLRRRDRAIRAVDWLREHRLDVRGHCLVWPGWRHLPGKLKRLEDRPEALAKAVLDHVEDEVSALRGKLSAFDVINEPFSNHALLDVLGKGAMVDWFRAARKADADLPLYINDYGILTDDRLDSPHQNHYRRTIAYLLEQGAPLNGIGLQGHFGSQLTPPATLLKILDRFARFDLPLQITELDINHPNEQLQADFMRDVLIAAFSHPAVDSVIMWGFWEGRHWRPDAALYDRDWTIRRHGQAWLDLVHKRWKTSETVRTDRTGRCSARGFLGTYTVRISHAGKAKSASVALTPDGEEVILRIDE